MAEIFKITIALFIIICTIVYLTRAKEKAKKDAETEAKTKAEEARRKAEEEIENKCYEAINYVGRSVLPY